MGESNDKGGNVTPRQRRAIAELLQTGSPTKAAAAVGVNPKTVHAWMHLPAFVAALAEAEADALACLSRRLVDLGSKATDTLDLAMVYDPKAPGARVTAAGVVLGNLLKLRELVTLQARVEALEAAILEVKR
jgi:hypothetical protein